MIRRLLIVCGMLFLCAFTGPAQAQKSDGTELFLPAEIPVGMSPPAKMMQRLYRPVQINKSLLDSAHPGQIVTLRLFTATPLSLKLERREEHIPGTYSWVGRLAGEIESLLIISVVKDAASLYLNVGGNNEMGLQYLRDGVHLLYVAEPQKDFRCGTGAATVRLPTPATGTVRVQAVAYVDTSICVSNQAVSEVGGFNAAVSKAINCVVYTNNACNNSNSQTQFNLYAVYQITFDESGTASQILSRFAANGTANDLLNRGKLDVVGLLISNFPAGDAAGIAYKPGRYSASQIDSYTERTYAHEVGHNVGNGHEPGDAYPSDPNRDRGVYFYSAGHHFEFLSQYFQTIMAYGGSYNGWWLRSLMPYYSNPSIRYESSPGIGGPTGVANDRDNARSMREYAGTVAAYASAGANVYVDGSTVLGSNGSELYPYKTVLEGMNAVTSGGNVWVKGPRNYNEKPNNANKPLSLQSWTGIVNVGKP